MPAQIQVITGPDKGRSFPLVSGELLQVGRSSRTTTQFNDPSVSRFHCEIQWDGSQAVVQDCKDSKGTFVNGVKVAQHILRNNDVIRIGGTELRFMADAGEEPTTLAPAPAAKLASNRPGAAAEKLSNLVGQTLTHYSIEDIIARGASAVVFRASDTRDGTTVALKVLQPEFSQEKEAMDRFVRAMKTMMPVRHPNLVAIHAAGRTGPYCWLAMEFVDGECLTAVIERIGVAGMLDWRHAFRVAVHIGRALEYAHGQSILHRNVTPKNILLRKSDKQALLGDLMLAKALEGTLAQDVTKPGELVGEVAYMSPERTRGGSAEVDERSDLYGLGATVYALVTGRPPFAGGTLPELITRIRNATPENPKKYQIGIPDLFQGTIMKLLAKQPDERFRSATEMLTDLERVRKFSGSALEGYT